MNIFFAIAVVIAFVIWIFSNKKKPKQTSTSKYISVDLETAHIIHASENNTLDLLEKSKESEIVTHEFPEVFYNHYGTNATDFSYLTPAQAEDEFNQRKAQGEYLAKEDYFGYMDAIARKYDTEYLQQIDKLTPEQTNVWFKNNLDLKNHMSSNVWIAAAEKISIYHEPMLLQLMDDVTPGKIEGWVSARKHEGYFFSTLCYTKARTKYLNQKLFKMSAAQLNAEQAKQAETIKRNIRRNKQKMNDHPSNETYKHLYNQYNEAYEFLTGEKYIEA